MKHAALSLALALIAASALADDGKPPSTGLSVFANANAYLAAKNAAAFYNGTPSSLNTINRVLHSDSYGRQIWQNLKTAGLISDAVGSYNQLQVAEYPDMYYKISYQIGIGFRYDYPSRFGWLLRFDLAKLQAAGVFNLSTDNGTGLLGRDRYIPCNLAGLEDRINIDLALTKSIPLSKALDLELDLGASLVNTKVRDNIMEIAGSTYSILDRWGGRTPDAGVADYEYVNQGRIGYGVFVSLLLGYYVNNVGALRLSYSCSHTRVSFENANYWGWQHSLGIRIEMNNFSFLNRQ